MVNARDLLTRPALWVPLAGALALGLAGGAVVTAFEPSLYRAETSLVVQRGGQPLAGGAKTADTVRTMRDLARSDVVATNVIRNLGLHRSPSALLGRVAVDTDAAVLRVRVDDGSKTRAKQIAQELALVFTQLVRARFGASGLSVSVFDPPHALDGRVSPHPVRNLAWGALVGLLVGSAATAAAAVRTAPVPSGPEPAAPPPREPPQRPLPEPSPPPAPEPEPEEPEPEPEPEAPAAAPPGRWSVAELERLVDEHAATHPERAEEWRTYLTFLREHEVGGVLPSSFDALVDEVFGSILY